MKKVFNLANIMFVLNAVLVFLPSKRDTESIWYVLSLLLLAELAYLLIVLLIKQKERITAAGDAIAIIYSLIFLWELFTTKLNLLDKKLYPTAGSVIAMFVSELPDLLKGLLSSIQLLMGGYLLALAVAVPLGLVIGWRKRLHNAVKPLTKVLGPIPPIVYIPYAIAILPNFKASSIFIIFIGAFWPIFINTLNGVFNIDKRIVDSAKALNVKEGTMLFQVILPGTIPSITSGANIGLVLSFILLTSAEMIGATSGLGWYVKYFSDFADYKRVIVGIVFIGIVVTGITALMDRLEHYLLRWKK